MGAVQAGAQGYLLKGAPRDEIFNAIRVISSGGSLLQPVVASRLLQRLNEKPDEPLVEPLTEREAEVLRHVREVSAAGGGPLGGDAVARLFERIIDEARSLEIKAAR